MIGEFLKGSIGSSSTALRRFITALDTSPSSLALSPCLCEPKREAER